MAACNLSIDKGSKIYQLSDPNRRIVMMFRIFKRVPEKSYVKSYEVSALLIKKIAGYAGKNDLMVAMGLGAGDKITYTDSFGAEVVWTMEDVE
jgi:hypothetical protein